MQVTVKVISNEEVKRLKHGLQGHAENRGTALIEITVPEKFYISEILFKLIGAIKRSKND